MTVTVLLFGPQASLAGMSERAIDLEGDAPTVRDVLAALAESAPELADSLPTSRLAVNHEFADPGAVVGPDDEVALIGMVSGG